MNHTFQALAIAILITTSVSGQTPARVDGPGGARTKTQTRPPDNRRPRGTAVALLGWKAGIHSDAFGAKGLSMIDEFYHFPPTGPYTREKLHVLPSVDAEKTDLRRWQIRPDNDYGMVRIKSFSKGRVFNSVLGHRTEFYMIPDLVKLMVGGIQFVLGDEEADTTPSARLANARK